MKNLREYLQIRKEKHNQDNDTIGCIVGLEGISKSTLGMHVLEEWLILTKGEVTEEDSRHMCLTPEMFVEDLGDLGFDEPTAFDEAGALSSRKTLSKFNTALSEAYQVIRAARTFTILILPDFWLLDSYFRNHRVKFLINVTARGKFDFWLRDKVQNICMLNEGRVMRTPYVQRPDFSDTFPKYKGVLLKGYTETKMQNIEETKQKLKKLFDFGDTIKTKVTRSQIEEEMIKKAWQSGKNRKELTDFFGITSGKLSLILNRPSIEEKRKRRNQKVIDDGTDFTFGDEVYD